MIPSRQAEDLLPGWWQLLRRLGAVPGCWCGTARARSAGGVAGAAEADPRCQAFRGTLGTRVIICRPGDPEAKGLVERANGYLETLVPARARRSPRRPTSTPSCRAGSSRPTTRIRRVLGCAPVDRWAPTGPRCWRCRRCAPATGWRRQHPAAARSLRARLDANDYSVHPAVIGRRVEVIADLDAGAGALRRAAGGRAPAAAGPGTRPSPTPTHAEAARALRRQRLEPCARRGRGTEVEVR